MAPAIHGRSIIAPRRIPNYTCDLTPRNDSDPSRWGSNNRRRRPDLFTYPWRFGLGTNRTLSFCPDAVAFSPGPALFFVCLECAANLRKFRFPKRLNVERGRFDIKTSRPVRAAHESFFFGCKDKQIRIHRGLDHCHGDAGGESRPIPRRKSAATIDEGAGGTWTGQRCPLRR